VWWGGGCGRGGGGSRKGSGISGRMILGRRRPPVGERPTEEDEQTLASENEKRWLKRPAQQERAYRPSGCKSHDVWHARGTREEKEVPAKKC